MDYLENFNFFGKDELKEYYGGLAKQFGITYKKTGEREFILGPKNGHEISVVVGSDACLVTSSYYGAIYGEQRAMIRNFEEYLQNFDFNSKPDVEHKFKTNEEFFYFNTEFNVNDVKGFAQWCLCNKELSFDCNGKFWFNSKSLQRVSWDDVLKLYFEE